MSAVAWGVPVQAGPPPRILPAAERPRPYEAVRRLMLPSPSVGCEASELDTVVFTAQLAALAEVLIPPAFVCTLRGRGRILVAADDLADVGELFSRVRQVHGENQPDTPVVLGDLESDAVLCSSWSSDNGDVQVSWRGIVASVSEDEVERLAEATERWVGLLSKGGSRHLPVNACLRDSSEIRLGGHRLRPDLLRTLAIELGAQQVAVDVDEVGLGLRCVVPEPLDPAQFRAGIRRRLANHPFPVRWQLNVDASEADTWLREPFLAACCKVLGEEVSAEDEFFALGGDSLGAMQVLRQVQASTGVGLDLATMLRALHTQSLGRAADALSQHRPAGSVPSEITVDPGSRNDPFPLTAQQEAYVMGRGSDFDTGGVSCHTYLEYEGGPVDPERLRLAWTRLYDRHGMLRVTIDASRFTQRIGAIGQQPPFQVVDLSMFPQPEADERLGKIREELSHRVAPLEGPLHTVCLVLLPGEKVRLCLSFDALATDLASIGVLFSELESLWSDPDQELPDPGLEFRDYVVSERNAQASEARAAALDYWERKLSTLPPAPRLPLASVPEATRFLPHPIVIDAEVWQSVRAQACAWGLTSSALLTACYAEALSRWSISQRFTLNVPRFNRRLVHAGVERVVGEFASIILVSVDRTRAQSFGQFARELQQQIWEDLTHQEVSGIEILRRLRHHAGADALMPVVLTSATFLGHDPTRLLGGSLHRIFRLSQTPQVDLDCIVEESAGALLVNWDHREGRVDPAVVVGLADTFRELVYRLSSPDAWSDVDPAPGHFDDPARCGAATTIPLAWAHEAVLSQAGQNAEDPALIGSDWMLDRGALIRWVRCLAAEVRAKVPGEGPIAVLLPKGAAQIAAVLAVCAIGRAYVPLDPQAPQARLGMQLEVAGASAVLVPAGVEIAPPVPGIPVIPVSSQPPSSDGPIPQVVPVSGDPGQAVCAVIFTSGSTGMPKAVMVRHSAVVNCVKDTIARLNTGPGDRFLSISALHHDMSMFDLFGVLGSGGCLVIPDGVDQRDADAMAELVARRRVTGWVSVPALMAMLAERASDEQLSSLRQVILGGDWIPPELCRELSQRVAGIRLIGVGGPTETTMWNIWHEIDSASSMATVPYGQPLSNSAYHLLDERGRPRPLGVEADLVCSGAGVSPGYVGGDDTHRFVVHPRSGQRLYRTGDRGVILDGQGPIWFRGRNDQQVQVNGYRIEPGEIEALLLRDQRVSGAVVLGIMRAGGRGYSGLAAFVTGREVQAEDLRQQLRDQLPGAMVPGSVHVLGSFPLTSNGKLDRAALIALTTRGDGEGQSGGPLVEVVSRFCAEGLGVSEVHPDQDLFGVGADSLFAARLATRIDLELPGIRLLLREVFATPTVRAMAAAMASRVPDGVADRIAELWLQTVELDTGELARMVKGASA